MKNIKNRGIPLSEAAIWLNADINPNSPDSSTAAITYADVEKAEKRLQRFAPLLQQLFPELETSQGLIESDLLAVQAPPLVPEGSGQFWVKADHALPVAGSIKARGGIHEVLEFVETLAEQHGLLQENESTCVLAQPAARAVLEQYSVAVGSTGNLGLSIGVIGAALGLQATVHMSAEAKEWKKERLRNRGVTVLEYGGDYALAVEAGRMEAAANDHVHFVDDEQSVSLFVGYAVAAKRLQQQLVAQHIKVDAEHPLFVYLPCGVGGAPGGVCYGLKHIFGEHVHCFFVEPEQAACFQLQMAHPERSGISIYDEGQTNKTEADGLAVPVASQVVVQMMRPRLSGVVTTSDDYLFADLYALQQREGMQVEPSAAAACSGPRALLNTAEGQQYIHEKGLAAVMAQSNHILWTTGGLFVPPEEYREFCARGERLAKVLFG